MVRLEEETNMNEVLHQEVLNLKDIAKDTEKFYQSEFEKLHDKFFTIEKEKHNLENQLREFRMKTDPLISKIRELKIENDNMKVMIDNFNKLEKNYNKKKVDLEITAVNYEKLYKEINLAFEAEKQKVHLTDGLIEEMKNQLQKLRNEKLSDHKKIMEQNGKIFELTKNLDKRTIDGETMSRNHKY